MKLNNVSFGAAKVYLANTGIDIKERENKLNKEREVLKQNQNLYVTEIKTPQINFNENENLKPSDFKFFVYSFLGAKTKDEKMSNEADIANQLREKDFSVKEDCFNLFA